jgi:hypothetical protein
MKNILFFSFLSLAVYGRSQGNLQFNQILTFGGLSNAGALASNLNNYLYSSPPYTVPSGKVWKIENVNVSNSSQNIIVNNLYVGPVPTGLNGTSPLWLKAGDVIRLAQSNSTIYTHFFSIIEFNVVP